MTKPVMLLMPLKKAFSDSARKASIEARRAKAAGRLAAGGAGPQGGDHGGASLEPSKGPAPKLARRPVEPRTDEAVHKELASFLDSNRPERAALLDEAEKKGMSPEHIPNTSITKTKDGQIEINSDNGDESSWGVERWKHDGKGKMELTYQRSRDAFDGNPTDYMDGGIGAPVGFKVPVSKFKSVLETHVKMWDKRTRAGIDQA